MLNRWTKCITMHISVVKKKHNIIEDFNTDEDFMTNDEAANLEDPAQDGSQTGEGVTVTGASGENTLTTNLAPMISPYW